MVKLQTWDCRAAKRARRIRATAYLAMIGYVVVAGLIIASMIGCSSIKPLVEVSHTSHATQHFGSNKTNYGWNVYSVGVRVRPYKGVTVDVLEGYTPERLDGRHEVFTARLQWEIGQ
jgi:hypothetical protein